ncbi:hypothetical protein BH23VER1_BH23VER1_28600 [soil metagenome]
MEHPTPFDPKPLSRCVCPIDPSWSEPAQLRCACLRRLPSCGESRESGGVASGAVWRSLVLGGIALAMVGAVPNGLAQDGGAQSLAEVELQRRQMLISEASQLVIEGDMFRTNGELQAAVQSYKEAIDTLPHAPVAHPTRQQAVERFAHTSVAYAHQRAADGHFEEAEALVDTVLLPGYDPASSGALKLKTQLQDPDHFNRAATPQHHANVEEVNRLLTQAGGLSDLGRFEEASETYARVFAFDPYNVAAARGMEETSRKVSGYLGAAYDQTRARLLGEVDAAWETQPNYEAHLSEMFGDGGLAFSDPARSAVATKLKEITFPQVDFSDATLQEVVTYLVARSRALDNSGDVPPGVNIVLNQGSTGASTSVAERRVSLSLTNVPLEEVLRYVTSTTRTRYRLEPYAVEIVDATTASVGRTRTRTFRVPPTFLTMGTGASEADNDPFAPGNVPTGGLALTRISAQEFLANHGIAFGEGMSARFNPTTSSLVVTNTEENLDLVAQMVAEAFAQSAQQVQIDVIMLETTDTHLQEIGFGWLLGGFNVPGSDRVFGSGGTFGNALQSADGPTGDFPVVAPGTDFPVGAFPVTAGNRSGGQISELTNNISGLLTNRTDSVVGAKAPGTFAVTGVLTDPQFQTVIRTLNQKSGSDIAMSPSVVTRSGQRAIIEVVREFIYPIEFDPPEIPQNFGITATLTIISVLGSSTSGGPGAIPATPATPTAFETRRLGTSLEVEPVIDPSGVLISLNLVPEFDEFEGFIDYGEPIRGIGNTIVTENRILQPVFRTIRENVTVDVFDGQTVVIGGLSEQRRTQVNDRVPVLGSVPGLGKLFRSDVTSVSTQAIVFLVKATIIDPGGNPVGIRSSGGGGAR